MAKVEVTKGEYEAFIALCSDAKCPVDMGFNLGKLLMKMKQAFNQEVNENEIKSRALL
jgi:hypothetical protein